MILTLPLPPSLNAAYSTVLNRDGKSRRVKTRLYQAWQWEAAMAVRGLKAKPVDAPFRFVMRLPMAMRGDVDNRIKPALDFCVNQALCPDDRHCLWASAERSDEITPGWCEITLETAA